MERTKSIKSEIRKNWTSGKHPISFSGINNVERYYPHVKRAVIEDALAGLDTYTLFREEKKPPKYNPIFVRRKRQILQSDLIDLSSLSAENNNIRYLLVLIDTFSRFVWIEPLKTKTTSEVLDKFKSLLPKLNITTNCSLMTDQGGEYVNKHFQSFLRKHKINSIVPNNKCPHVERFNRTFQNILYKYMEENQTKKYIDKLQDFVHLYNNRYHRIIKTTPFKAENPDNYETVLAALEQYYAKNKRKNEIKPKFKLGDHVRITAKKTMFHKGYYQTFKPKLYKISEVLTHLIIPMYRLEDLETGAEEAGTWYSNELQLVSKDYKDTLFKIEKIVKYRGKGNQKEALVKWQYWPESENSWVKVSEIEQL